MNRRPNTQTVQWFLEIEAAGQLDLEPPYQRRSVWSDDYRRFYIDSVLRDFPSPAIYLQVETVAGAPTIYHVIDGKQRLLALIEFSKDEFHTGGYLEEEGLASTYYSDFPQEYKDKFVDYTLSVENITRASRAELKDAFDRLNRNVARLTKQELRHAMFEGVLISRMESMASGAFWTELGLTTRANVSRMRDVEFVSELFLLTMHGVQDGKPSILDEFYAEYDSGIPDEEDHRTRFDEVMNYLRSLPLDWPHTRWSNMADLYGLWAGVLDLPKARRPAKTRAAERLASFEGRVKGFADRLAARELRDPEDEEAVQYYDVVRQGSNKDTNRGARAEILKAVLLNE